jgi:hypothetical protein
MNRKQLIVIWVGIGLIVGLCIYPPWYGGSWPGPCAERRHGGHALLWNREDRVYMLGTRLVPGIRLDRDKLALECAIVIVLTAGLWVTFGDRKSPQG